jgi:phosphoglycolate phosphatase
MRAYFLDLDGTLTDSRMGLHTSFRAAIDAIGVPQPTDEELDRFLGTPLPEMFRVLRPDISKAEIELGMKAFRHAYETVGIAQNRLYPGVCEALEAIIRRGGISWVVTSKPEHYARRVTQDLGLQKYLKGVTGAGLDEIDTKATLIGRALLTAKVPRDKVVMLGDRHYDVEGALQNNVMPIGALWGYGTYEELHGAGCLHFAKTPDEFRERFVEGNDDDALSSTRVTPALG